MNKTIEFVIFDLGGVLINWNPRFLYRKISSDEKKIEFFLQNICTQEWNEGRDAGETFATGIQELSHKHPEYAEWISAYFARWEEMLNGEISGTVAILKELQQQKRHRLLGLSNWSAETFPIAQRQFEFLKIFEAILVSGHERKIKPSLEFYQILADRHHVDFSKTVFIDDVQKNILAAEKLGIHGILFQSPEALRDELRKLKVLPS